MNKRQKEVQAVQLNDEQRTIRELKQVYKKASEDCAERIRQLSTRTDFENLQTIVYQKQYQEALKKQIDGVLDTLNGESFTTVAAYLEKSYDNGFFGTLYDLQGQGIPLVYPIDQEQVVAALQTDSKISQGLYKRMGEDTKHLKNSIRAELSRGITNGESWNGIAAKIASGMNSPFDKAYHRTCTIARTEGHRVQQTATYHCQQKAKSKGADVVKQWDSTLDGLTRPWHMDADGQVAEIDQPFEVMGEHLMFPSDPAGSGKNVINCRCCSLQRARWAISDEEYYTKFNGDSNELVKVQSKSYNDFRNKVKETLQKADIISNDEHLKVLTERLQQLGVDYNPVGVHESPLSESEIIDVLGGGDKTSGSCASVGLAYIGQKLGLDVRDFRGGESQSFFSMYLNLKEITKFPNIESIFETARSQLTVGSRLVKQVEAGKEYYLCVGRHAAMVRKSEQGTLQYLELQSEKLKGWRDFDGNPKFTLHTRFGCRDSRGCNEEGFMIDISNLEKSDELQTLLGYINTSVGDEKKGVGGHAK